MGMSESLERLRDIDESRAQAQEDRDEVRADSYAAEFDRLVATRNLDAETGCRFMPRLSDVLCDAVGDNDDSFFKTMMQALLHCANKGQIEAMEAMAKVRNFYVTKRMEP